MQLGFFGELTNAFGGPSTATAIRKKVAAFGRAVAPIASLGSLVGVDASKAVEGAANALGGTETVADARRKLERALAKEKRPVLVVIDDLDRVTAEELLLTLKLVRQLGRLPYVHYLLSYDELTILDVLTRTSLVGEQSPARARDYMEKVVQIRFDIPRLRPSDALRLTNAALSELAQSTGFALSEDDSSRYSSAYFGFLASRLVTPRAVKRYFAQIRLLSPSMVGEVDYVDFLILTWLRTFEPGVYALLQSRRSELVGDSRSSLYARPDAPKLKDAADRWRESLLVAGTKASEIQPVALAVASLFPRFAAIWAETGGSGETAKMPRVSHESYFDRYFSFGLPEGDIADSVVRSAIEAFESEAPKRKPAYWKVQIAFQENPDLVIDKISRDIASNKPTAAALFGWLAELYVALPPPRDSVISSRRRLENVVGERLREMSVREVTSVVRSMVSAGSFDLLLGALERAIRPLPDGTPALQLAPSQTKLLALAMAPILERSVPPEVQLEDVGRIWSWSRIDPERFAEWIEHLRSQDPDDINTLAFFVGSSRPVGTSDANARLRRLNEDEAAQYFNLDELRLRYAADIAAAPHIDVDDWDGPPDTPSNRRNVALLSLRLDDESG